MEELRFSKAECLTRPVPGFYGRQAIPHPIDDAIRALILRWTKLTPSAREAAGRDIDADQRFRLGAFSERMASMAVRERDPELLFAGLLALGIDGGWTDWRENVLRLCLHYDAALKIGVRPEDVFERAAALLPFGVADGFREFPGRSAADRSLEAMGYEESRDDDGFRYRRTW